MLVEDRVGLIEDSTGDRTVERLVDSSLSMLKDEQAFCSFMALGVCPEDVLVELPAAQLICGSDAAVAAAGKLSSMSMRRIVKTLVDRNLLQGSIVNGVVMHGKAARVHLHCKRKALSKTLPSLQTSSATWCARVWVARTASE